MTDKDLMNIPPRPLPKKKGVESKKQGKSSELSQTRADRLSLQADEINSSSFVEGLKLEWSLFWDSIKSENSETEVKGEDLGADQAENPIIADKIERLSPEKLKVLTRALSQDRKLLNQSIERVRGEIDSCLLRLENLRLVKGDTLATESEIEKLSDVGQTLAAKLDWVNEKMRETKSLERRQRDKNEDSR